MGTLKGPFKTSPATNNLMTTEGKYRNIRNIPANFTLKVMYYFSELVGVAFYIGDIISNLRMYKSLLLQYNGITTYLFNQFFYFTQCISVDKSMH